MFDQPSPFTPPDEDTAFTAFTALDFVAANANTTDPAKAAAVAAFKTKEPEHRATLDSYRQYRRARNLPLFPTRTAAANRERADFLRNIYTKPLADVLPPDQYSIISDAATASGSPDEFLQGQVNRTFLSAVTNQPLEGAAYIATRELYARQHLGLTGEVTDAAFFNAIKTRHLEDDATSQKITEASKAAFLATLDGTPTDTAAALATLPDTARRAAAQSIQAARIQAEELRRRSKPAVDAIASMVQAIKESPVNQEASIRQNIVSMAANLSDRREERDVELAILAAEFKKLPEESRTLIDRILSGIERGANSLVEGSNTFGYEAARFSLDVGSKLMAAMGYDFIKDVKARDDLKKSIEVIIQDRTRVSQLKQVIQGEAFTLEKASESWLAKGLVKGSQSIPYTFLAVTPYGFGAMATSMAGQSIQQARIESPETEPRLRFAAGALSGVTQAATETVLTKLGLKLATGRIPTLTNLLNRANVTSRAARAAIGAPLAAIAVGGTEMTEEIAQDATDSALQQLATELSGVNSNMDWRKFLTDWTGGQKFQETLLAITPFMLLAGGIAGVKHVRNGDYYLRNVAMMKGAGFTPEEIKTVMAAPTAEAAQAALVIGAQTAQARAATLTPEQAAEQADARAAALDALRERTRTLAAAGVPVVESFTDTDTEQEEFIFHDPTTGERTTYATEAEALDRFTQWAADLELDAISKVTAAAKPDFIANLTAEGQAAELVNIEDTGKARTLGTDLAAAEADVKAATTAEKKASTPAARRAAQEKARAAQATIGALNARFKIFLLDHGLDPSSAIDAFRSLPIRAASVAETVAGKVVGWTVRLYEGATISDIAEDVSETVLKSAISEDLLNPHALLDDIRAYERATGRRIIESGYDYTAENYLPLVEGFSKLARGYMLAESRSDLLPPSVRQWAAMVTAFSAASVDAVQGQAAEIMADVSTAADLRAAIAAGTLPERLRSRLADSLGLNETERMARLQQQMEAQLAAEALGDFPEISDVLRGQLPHPTTARQKGLALAGELQRIYNAMIRPTRRKTKTGQAIDRTNEANAYFLPIGTSADVDAVRRSINQDGFAFDTPAEMLEALELSIAYGKPTYGTASQNWESFAFGTPALGRMRGKNAIRFENPILTPLGKVIGYEWQSKLIESDTGGTEGIVLKRVSDWDKATTNAETGRDIVHHFTIEKEGGEISTVSLESTLKSAGTNAKDLKTLISTARRLPLREAEFEQLSQDVAEYDKRLESERRRVSYLTPPQPTWKESEFERIREQGRAEMYVGEIFVSVEDQSKPFPFDRIEYGRSKWKDSQMDLGMAKPDFERLETLKRMIRKDRQKLQSSAVSMVTPAASQESFALSLAGTMTLDQAILRMANRGPEERVEFLEKLRNRLAGTILMLRESRRNLATDQTDAERERNRIRDALMEAQAILAALPPEARSKVRMPVTDILEAETERGQINALRRLIVDADEALETVLVDAYRDAFEKLIDLAKPDLRQNKQLRGRLTPEAQRLVAQILQITTLTPDQHQFGIHSPDGGETFMGIVDTEAAIQALYNKTPDSPEQAEEMQRQAIALETHHSLLQTFGPWTTMDAAGLASAYQSLQGIYSGARQTRNILDEAKREEIRAARNELLGSLPDVDQPTHADAMHRRSVAQFAQDVRLAMSSFHQVMEFLFPNSATARKFQDLVRAADRAFTRARIDAASRFDAATFAAFNLSGPGRRRRRNRIIHDLSTLKTDWNITLREGIVNEKISLSEEQAAAILAGTLKTGWETDRIALMSLGQALADFRMQRLRAQNEDRAFSKRVIHFSRIKSRGQAAPLHASQLEAVYYLQLWAQEQYRPALDKYGFTQEIIDQIEAKLDPRAVELADILRTEYDAEYTRLNPVYRAIFHMDMPRIRNYAPGSFDHMDGRAGGATIDPYGEANPVNAMSAGFTKARTHHMARPKQQNALAAYWSHLEATEYFIAYAELMRDARQVFRHPEVRRRIEGIHGKETATLFSQWLDALELDGNFRSVTTGFMAELGSKAIATQSAIALAFNVGVLFKQIPAFLGVFMDTYNTKEAITGLFRAIANPTSLRAVYESEAVQQRILQGISPEDRKLLKAGAASPSMLMELLEAGRLPIAYADAAFSTLAGAAAYQIHHAKAKAAGLSDDAAESSALAAAARLIERTAQPATTQDRSMAELTAKGWLKFLFLFKSDPRQKLAIVAAAVEGFKSGKVKTPEAARKFFFGWAVYGLANQFMSDLAQTLFRDDDDPDKWEWEDYVAGLIVGPLSALPLIGSAFEYAVRSTVSSRAFLNTSSPIDAGLSKLFSKIPSIWKDATDGKTDPSATINDYLTTAQQVTSAAAQVAGAFDPRAAALPAVVRLIRDAQGLAANAYDALTGDTPDDAALAIVRTFQEADKKARDGNAEASKALAKELLAATPTDRAARLAKLPPKERSAMKQKLRAAEMTASETALSNLSAEARIAAVEKILATLPESQRQAYRDRLASLGLLE